MHFYQFLLKSKIIIDLIQALKYTYYYKINIRTCTLMHLIVFYKLYVYRRYNMQFGFFDDINKEYVITTPETPLPWINYLGCENFFSLKSNTGGGYCFYKDAKLLRLTRYRYNNSPLDNNGHYIYIKDEDIQLFLHLRMTSRLHRLLLFLSEIIASLINLLLRTQEMLLNIYLYILI